MPAPCIAIRNLDHLGLVAGLCQELDIARMIDAVLPKTNPSKSLMVRRCGHDHQRLRLP